MLVLRARHCAASGAQVALGIVLACSEELLAMRDMEPMVDLLRFGVPQWRHERLQARHEANTF